MALVFCTWILIEHQYCLCYYLLSGADHSHTLVLLLISTKERHCPITGILPRSVLSRKSKIPVHQIWVVGLIHGGHMLVIKVWLIPHNSRCQITSSHVKCTDKF